MRHLPKKRPTFIFKKYRKGPFFVIFEHFLSFFNIFLIIIPRIQVNLCLFIAYNMLLIFSNTVYTFNYFLCHFFAIFYYIFSKATATYKYTKNNRNFIQKIGILLFFFKFAPTRVFPKFKGSYCIRDTYKKSFTLYEVSPYLSCFLILRHFRVYALFERFQILFEVSPYSTYRYMPYSRDTLFYTQKAVPRYMGIYCIREIF